MHLKELIIKLGVENLAPFHFVDSLKYQQIAECKHMSYDELKDYKNGVHDKNKIYNESELGIYIINTDVENLYNMAIESDPYLVKNMIDEISYYVKVEIKYKSLIYATYVILHELGHWINFKESNMSSLEYCIWDSNYRKEAHSNEMYKNIPSEKEADKFALDNIKEYLKKIGILA